MIEIHAHVVAILLSAVVGLSVLYILTIVAWRLADDRATRAQEALRALQPLCHRLVRAYDNGDAEQLAASVTEMRGQPPTKITPVWIARRGWPPNPSRRRLRVIRGGGSPPAA